MNVTIFCDFTLFSGAGNHLATGLHFTPTVIEGRCYFWQMKGSKISVILWLFVLPWSMFVLNYTDSESWRKLLGLKDDGLIRNYCTSAFPTYAANRLADLYKATEWCQNILYVKTTNFDLSTVFTLSWIAYNVPNIDFIVLLRHTHCRKHTKTKPSSVLMVADLVTQESSRLKSCRPKPESGRSILSLESGV